MNEAFEKLDDCNYSYTYIRGIVILYSCFIPHNKHAYVDMNKSKKTLPRFYKDPLRERSFIQTTFKNNEFNLFFCIYSNNIDIFKQVV